MAKRAKKTARKRGAVKFTCKHCGVEIPKARVKLGYTETCVNHSDEVAHMGLQEFGHKTAGYAVIIRGGRLNQDERVDREEQIRRARRAYERGRDR